MAPGGGGSAEETSRHISWPPGKKGLSAQFLLHNPTERANSVRVSYYASFLCPTFVDPDKSLKRHFQKAKQIQICCWVWLSNSTDRKNFVKRILCPRDLVLAATSPQRNPIRGTKLLPKLVPDSEFCHISHSIGLICNCIIRTLINSHHKPK